MDSAQVQRTLVKSPPELWAELSDPAALARHLGELGDIRITRIEPEHKVEWTAAGASGTVLIKPSAWGTQVTLTASSNIAGPEHRPGPHAYQLQHPPPPDPAAPGAIADQPEPGAVKPQGPGEHAPQPALRPRPDAQPEPEPSREQGAPPEPRRGFLTRLLGLRRRIKPSRQLEATDGSGPAHDDDEPDATWTFRTETAAPQPESLAESAAPSASHDSPTLAAQPAALAFATPQPEIAQPEIAQPEIAQPEIAQPEIAQPEIAQPELAAQPALHPGPSAHEREDPVEASSPVATDAKVVAEDVEAVLTSVLDRLGAAHHRPFSRA